MAYMCMGCYEVYDRDLGYCPKSTCLSEVVEIDDLMLPAIKMLNEKGYMTEFCCSGHVYDNGCNIYVTLDGFMLEVLTMEEIEEMKQMLPSPWEVEIDQFERLFFSRDIKKDWEYKLVVETYEDILKANLEFLKFVEKLPTLEY